MNQNTILKFEKISFTYPSNGPLLMENFNLEIKPGTVTAILGPNGAGKTTFLHLALGWLKPLSGSIYLDQQLLSAYSRRELGQWLGLVPQTEHISFEFSLIEFILLGRAPHLPPLGMPGELDFQIASKALKQVGLSALANRSILSLSGGERQLVLLARALAQQPRLLLLDEPTSHLDLSNKSRMIQLLHDLSDQGVTILFTTHEPDVASILATHLVLMKKGQVLQTGRLEEVFTGHNLTELYGIPVAVATLNEKRVALWT
ncbi:MAG: ABC transporter ATP-binding protein [Anaerolineaceae bacterium]|nr:ABC transporter ATP-binding protein [Anaerolineaceae bacterium]